jgi:hypothetical protein
VDYGKEKKKEKNRSPVAVPVPFRPFVPHQSSLVLTCLMPEAS